MCWGNKFHFNFRVNGTVVSKLITDRHFSWVILISNYRYRIMLPEEFNPITETDLWKSPQKVSHYSYRVSLDFQFISTTDTDFLGDKIQVGDIKRDENPLFGTF